MISHFFIDRPIFATVLSVVILIVGRKVGNRLIVEGEEFHGHLDHPAEPPGDGAEEDAE